MSGLPNASPAAWMPIANPTTFAAGAGAPNDICQMVGIDKGAVAKALKVLSDADLVATGVNLRDARSKLIRLIEADWALHDRILTVALARQERLLEP